MVTNSCTASPNSEMGRAGNYSYCPGEAKRDAERPGTCLLKITWPGGVMLGRVSGNDWSQGLCQKR